MTPSAQQDPYLHLEAVDSPEALAWVTERSDATVADLAAGDHAEASHTRALEILDATDRIAWPVLRGGYAYNVWKDRDHPRGLWRRVPWSVLVGGAPAFDHPAWETLIDVDALAEAEGVNWVYAGTVVRRPEDDRALIRLSRGGADAVEVREFDLLERVPPAAEGVMVTNPPSGVRIGGLEGWMMKQYLAFGDDMNKVRRVMPQSIRIKPEHLRNGLPLYARITDLHPRYSHRTYQDLLYNTAAIGVVGDQWYYVWLDDGTLFRLADDEFWLFCQERHLPWFHSACEGFDADVADRSEALAGFSLQGPVSWATAEAAGLELAELRPFQLRRLSWQGAEIIASRTVMALSTTTSPMAKKTTSLPNALSS